MARYLRGLVQDLTRMTATTKLNWIRVKRWRLLHVFSLSYYFFISSDDCYHCQLYMGPEALANVYYTSRKYK